MCYRKQIGRQRAAFTNYADSMILLVYYYAVHRYWFLLIRPDINRHLYKTTFIEPGVGCLYKEPVRADIVHAAWTKKTPGVKD